MENIKNLTSVLLLLGVVFFAIPVNVYAAVDAKKPPVLNIPKAPVNPESGVYENSADPKTGRFKMQ